MRIDARAPCPTLRVMNLRALRFVSLLGLAACGGFHVDVPTVPHRTDSPLARAPASAIEVVLSPEMAEDKVAMLQRHRVLETIQDRVAQALANEGRLGTQPGGPLVLIAIREFRNPRYGAAFLVADVELRAVGGAVLHRFEARESTQRATSRTGRLRIVTQGVVDGVVAGL
jgi:hypothetical protein